MIRLTTLLLAIMLAVAGTAVAHDVAVVDGDTVSVAGERWRLIGFDCAETYFAKCESEYKLGIVATARLQQLLDTAKKVETVTDGRRDRYGRILGRLFINGKDVAALMMADGLCRPYVCTSHCPKREGWC